MVEKMLSRENDRRGLFRYEVEWNALLEIRFSDFQDRIPVSVVNYSDAGALLISNCIQIGNRQFVNTEPGPELRIRIFSPEGSFQQRISIRWFNWLANQRIFEMGIKFVDLSRERELMLEKFMKGLEDGKTFAESLVNSHANALST